MFSTWTALVSRLAKSRVAVRDGELGAVSSSQAERRGDEGVSGGDMDEGSTMTSLSRLSSSMGAHRSEPSRGVAGEGGDGGGTAGECWDWPRM